MTAEPRDLTKRRVTAEEAQEAAKRFIDTYFGNEGRKPKICVPAQPDDDDLVLVTYIKESITELAKMRAEVDRLNGLLERAAEVLEGLTTAFDGHRVGREAKPFLASADTLLHDIRAARGK